MQLSLLIFTYLLVIFSLIPLIRHDYWTFRVFEYPRNQKFLLCLILLVLWAWVGDPSDTLTLVTIGVLILNMVYLFYQLYPYTFLSPKQLMDCADCTPDRNISLLISNVYQYNRESAKLLQHISRLKPDVVLLAETDQWWADQMTPIHQHYPNRVLQPIDNTYGMLLYSKLKLSDASVKFLVEEGIPSIHAKVTLPSNEQIQLYCLHPTPPVPQENPRSTERDKELLMVGKEAKKSKIPVIVAGDMNDVAWSYTTELFLKTSGLLDPRRGRGFYSTFHAKIPILRFPLDHIFCSSDFKLLEMQRLKSINSDHFPMYVKLTYDPQAEALQKDNELTLDAEDREVVEEKIQADTDSDGSAKPEKNPIGT
ncbi:endonuclease/exonuclease/phosphatase family protein [Siphonobacter sp. SORGH_AS_0500]|uniref:endonuclease/exonuclease/phosphatase family protein n=1 Tax=Siphonobacter sp. SORGH_AS_0500 TaxID=1864824 RepID=UPI000CC4BDC5|nr:endonuclease/exonuclease/phosphatase family protein [Siphonobacter sp. SORGH_AS_0500]MDR6194982.1 endonuclease/exonuclease/phosphatase (EEP) superfamily protein YafD [Siphonobacter sp. SORGH_AS_0500]PKK38472.1 endonuclease [Siphonobacter sp. SORGH_AS_0500]